MNIVTYSPIMPLLFDWSLLWMTMDVRFRNLTPLQKRLVPLLFVFLTAINQGIRTFGGISMLSRLIPLTMYLPLFLFFLYLTKYSVIKVLFMALTVLPFSSPIVLVTTCCKRVIPLDSPLMLLINLATCALMLLVVFFTFRRGFQYLLKYGDNKLFALLCLVPLLYDIYALSVANVDLTGMTSVNWIFIRALPHLFVYVFYFLLLYNNRELGHELEVVQVAMSQELDAAEEQLALMHEAQRQSAVYHHDMRHHLTAIDGFLTAGSPRQAQEYIKKVHIDIDKIIPKRFCENELVNLLCSSFSAKAECMGVRLKVETAVPASLSIPDTELCALLSNGLENSLNAAGTQEGSHRWVEFYCGVRMDKLLIEIRNPYTGQILFRNGLPAADQPNHGYGCRSIRAIAQTHQGMCEFSADSGIFTLRVALPAV